MHSITIRFNQKSKQWMEEGLTEITEAKFRLYVYNRLVPLIPDQRQPGRYYPIRDNCSKVDDPPEGCVASPSFSWTANVTLKSDWHVPMLLLDGSHVVMNTTIWRSWLLKPVISICLRVRKNNTHFIPDSPPEWPIYGEDVGCEASNKWEPLTYAKSDNNTLTITVSTLTCVVSV